MHSRMQNKIVGVCLIYIYSFFFGGVNLLKKKLGLTKTPADPPLPIISTDCSIIDLTKYLTIYTLSMFYDNHVYYFQVLSLIYYPIIVYSSNWPMFYNLKWLYISCSDMHNSQNCSPEFNIFYQIYVCFDFITSYTFSHIISNNNWQILVIIGIHNYIIFVVSHLLFDSSRIHFCGITPLIWPR